MDARGSKYIFYFLLRSFSASTRLTLYWCCFSGDLNFRKLKMFRQDDGRLLTGGQNRESFLRARIRETKEQGSAGLLDRVIPSK